MNGTTFRVKIENSPPSPGFHGGLVQINTDIA